MQKTEEEIIQETIDAYTVNTRSINELGSCVYLNPEGKKCALGRCLTDEGINIVHKKCETISAKGILENRNIPKDIFKPEYSGHPIEFWMFIQGLHDNGNYWDANGPSELGYSYVKLRYPDFKIPNKD